MICCAKADPFSTSDALFPAGRKLAGCSVPCALCSGPNHLPSHRRMLPKTPGPGSGEGWSCRPRQWGQTLFSQAVKVPLHPICSWRVGARGWPHHSAVLGHKFWQMEAFCQAKTVHPETSRQAFRQGLKWLDSLPTGKQGFFP